MEAWEQYQQAMELAEAGKLGEAIQNLEGLVKEHPEYPNALNFLGFHYTGTLADQPGAKEKGLAFLEEAVRRFPQELRPVANLIEAQVRFGQPQLALAAARGALKHNEYWPEVLTLLGWVRAVVLDDDGGLDDLGRAVTLAPRLGDAHFNLGRALLKRGRAADALSSFQRAADAGCFRTHEAHARCGELESARGNLRRALGHFRSAARLDERGEFVPALGRAQVEAEEQLRAQGKFFLHPGDELAFSEVELLEEFDLERAKNVARAAEELLEEPGAKPYLVRQVKALVAIARAGKLDPAHAGQPIRATLAELGGKSGGVVAKRWKRVLFRWYQALLDAEERGESPEVEIDRLALEGDFGAALERLERWGRRDDLDDLYVAGEAEKLGDLAHSRSDGQSKALYALSENRFRAFASGATSGAEGLGRMVDVERVVKKLQL